MTTKHYIRFAVAFLFIALLLFFFFKLSLILMPFLVAYILQYALKPLVNILEQNGIKHLSAVIVVFVVFFGILILFFRLFIPAVVSEILGIQDNLSEYSQVLKEKTELFESKFLGENSGVAELLNAQDIDFKENLNAYITDSIVVLLKKAPSFIFNILPLILYIFVIPFATFFFLLDEHRIKKLIISHVPNRYFETTLNLGHSLNRQFGWLLMGMFISAVIISTLVSTGLWIIGLEYPILVGIFSGLANLIPYAGPIVGAVSAFLIAMMTGSEPVFFLYILLVFLTVNLIDNVFVQPLVLARAANLHPLVVIFLVLFGSKIAGILGMLIAVPLVSLLQVVFVVLYTELARPFRPDFSKFRDIKTTPPKPLMTPQESII